MSTKWRLFFDGGCEPQNPGGWMVWSWVLYRGDLREYGVSIAEPCPRNTNNVAEYLALHDGLKRAKEIRQTEFSQKYPGLVIRGDSNLVCMQVGNKWKVKNERLKTAHIRCHIYLTELSPYEIQWIPRDQNSEADELGRTEYAKVVGRPMPDRHKHALK